MFQHAVTALWNHQTRRPRLPWRLVVIFLMLGVLGVALTAVSPFLRDPFETVFSLAIPGAQAAAATRNVLFVTSQLLTYFGAVYLAGRFIDRRGFSDFGLHLDRDWWLDLGFGLALGVGLMTGIFVVELGFGWVGVTDTFRIDQAEFAFWPWFGWALVTFVGIGVTEELLARGYLIKNLSEGLTWFDRIGPTGAVALAILGSALLFASGHFANPNASLGSTVGIFVAAVMLAAGYVLTGELAIPIGVHITWNFFEGPVYGFPVSGIDFGLSVLAVQQRGPEVVTGGDFGPEAGALGVLASVVGTGLIAAWVYRREGRLRIHPSVTTPDLRV